MDLLPLSLSQCECVLSQERQESREAAGAQLRREKTAHKEQCRQLMEQLERLRGEKREGDREIGTLRASLKGETYIYTSSHTLTVCVCVCVCQVTRQRW